VGVAAVLDLRAVSVVRSGSTILRSVDWAVEEGERWAVLGPNGAGKTTLLQIASTHLHPTRGEAWVLGEQLGAVDVFELRPRIGLASAALAERVPAGERVLDVVRTAAYGMVGRWRERYDAADDARARALLETLGADALADRAFGTLSEGERKRVQIARALLGSREDLVRRLSGLAADTYGPALVLVTHHVEEIPPGFTHALLLREGAVVAAGPLDEALTAATLSAAFALPLVLEQRGGRYSARMAD